MDRGFVVALLIVGALFFAVVTRTNHNARQQQALELQSQLCDKEREIQLLRFGTYKADCEK